jgi:hypothetical protein
MTGIWPYVAAIIPSAGVGFLFWVVVKNMIEGDRKERLAHSQWESEHRLDDVASSPDPTDEKKS